MYFIDDNYLDIKNSGIKEGGVVRNTAWIRYLKNHKECVKYINLSFSGRFSRYLNYLKYLICTAMIRDEQVFFLYPKVGLPILGTGWKGRVMRKWYLNSLNRLIRHNNRLVFDISDIKYEQAIDLELDYLDMDGVREFEKQLLELGQDYIFASYSMRDYAVKEHGILQENTQVCINGGHPFVEREIDELPQFDVEKIYYVYAGTLNKGRMIEQMIQAFPETEEHQMLLLGSGGEWIPEYLSGTAKSNIRYLGGFEEETARQIVARCDVGLIPYDNSRLYYNIAYPTKLSFYITAGIPYLSTPVAEVERVQELYDLGYTVPLEQWSQKICAMTRRELLQKKEKIAHNQKEFAWDHVFDQCSFF